MKDGAEAEWYAAPSAVQCSAVGDLETVVGGKLQWRVIWGVISSWSAVGGRSTWIPIEILSSSSCCTWSTVGRQSPDYLKSYCTLSAPFIDWLRSVQCSDSEFSKQSAVESYEAWYPLGQLLPANLLTSTWMPSGFHLHYPLSRLVDIQKRGWRGREFCKTTSTAQG